MVSKSVISVYNPICRMRSLVFCFLALGVVSCPSGSGGSSSLNSAIATGVSHTCALTSSGRVYCWGWGDAGRLGYGDNADRRTPGEAISGLSGVRQISLGNSHTCAQVSGGRVHCWGSGSNGQLGYGNSTVRFVPGEAIPGLSGVSQIDGGAGGYTCALASSGRVHCWGWGDGSRLGYGNDSNRLSPGETIPDLSEVAQISAGELHVCALIRSGRVHCWGGGNNGRLGYGNDSNRPAPGEAIPGLNAVTQISAGGSHTCALVEGGSVHCWGSGAAGLLGYGDESERSAPGEAIPGLSNVRQISAGDDHTCALVSNGSVHCWGSGGNGELGYGNRSNRFSPGEAIPDFGSVNQISAGDSYTCASVAGGSVHCWGLGDAQRLGYGNDSDRLAPGEPIPSFSLTR